jgi:hypothetical protein
MTNNASTAYDFVFEISGRPQGDPRDAEIARLKALLEKHGIDHEQREEGPRDAVLDACGQDARPRPAR